MHSPRRPRLAVFAAVSALTALAVAPSAHAGLSTDTTCTSPTGLSRPFMRWLDPAQYALAPGGDIEGTLAGWTLSGGAGPVSGNESFYVNAKTDRRSLALPAGSSATTAAACLGLEHPTMRFFVRRTSGSLLSTLRVDVLGVDALGQIRSLASLPVLGTKSWAPSPHVLVLSNLSGLLESDGTTPVAFRFTAAGASWQIDDVYVDPFRRG